MEQKKSRFSKQRQAILDVVKSTNTHPTADWIYEEVQKDFPHISLGTVYRNLGQLVDNGTIIRLRDDTMVRYDGNVHHHDHFQCTVCHAWYDIEILTEDMIKSIHRKNGFRIHSINLELRGVCENCLSKG